MILVAYGAVSIYAASYDFDNASLFDLREFSGKQILWIGLSLVIGCVIMITDYRIYKTYAYPIYIGVLIILLITIFIAPDIKGSHSWIKIGSMSLQPAEFGKFATALALAKLFDISFIFVLYREGMSGLVLFSVLCAISYFVVAIKFADPLILGMPSGEFTVFILIMLVFSLMLLFYCKDIIIARNVIYGFVGSGLVVTILSLCHVPVNGLLYFIIIIAAAIIYTAIAMFRHRIRKFLITIGFALVSVVFLFSVNYVFSNVLEPHQQMRIKVALGIEENLQGAGYNVNQSKIAIGSGGITGKGFLNGTQTKLKYVPEQHTDFIFCTIGEEQGFIGTTTVLILFLLSLIHI